MNVYKRISARPLKIKWTLVMVPILMLVLSLFGIFLSQPVHASPKSLYVCAEHHMKQFQAWDIGFGGIATYQATYTLAYTSDPAGIAIDESSNMLFVTSEFSTGIEFFDATTLTTVGWATSGLPSDLAGIEVDDANDVVYTVRRWTDDLYVLDWDPSAKTLTLKAGYPIDLPGCSGAFGIALDETSGILWVADSASKGVVGDRDIFEVSGLGTGPVDFEVISGDFDTILGLFDAGGNLIAANDNGGVGLLSRFAGITPDAGVVRFGITAYADFSFNGEHSETSGSYRIAIWPSGSSVPTSPIVSESEPNTGFADRNIFGPEPALLIDGSIVQIPIPGPFVRAYDTTTWTEDTSKSFTPSHQPVDVAVDRVRGFVYTVSMSSGASVPSGCGSNYLSKWDGTTETTVDMGHEGVGIAVDEASGLVYVTGTPPVDNLEVWDTSTTPWTQVQATGDIGNPAGICIPQEEVSYNPLNLAKDDGIVDCVNPGDTITYTISFDNSKNAVPVHNVKITDYLPSQTDFVSATGGGIYDAITLTVTWNIGTLAAGAPTQTVTLVVSVKPGTTPGTLLDNIAEIYSDETPKTTVHEYTDVCKLAATIESCDPSGTKKDNFDFLIEDVYVVGSYYAISTTYDIYMVDDVDPWTDGMVIPPRVPGTALTISSDPAGDVPPTLVWGSPLVPGKYDIVIDVNGNGLYDEGVDALDDSDIKVTAGFFIIPELPLGTILGLATCFAALGVVFISKRVRLLHF